jgi:hypothetical protein
MSFRLKLWPLVFGALAAGPSPASANDWWSPDDGRVMPAQAEYENELGRLRVVNANGAFSTKGHAFFSAIGTNGRACVTCHQPADGMSISAATAQRRWEETDGKDPLFAAVDGSNCPSLPQGEKSSHSLLLERGLFRIPLPWPPRDAQGRVIEPEFTIEVVSDPTGCNLDPVYGLHSDNPRVSVFRRPRPAANLRYVMEIPHGVAPYDTLFFNDRTLLPRDPETGEFVPNQLMSDGRAVTLKLQAQDAAVHHLQVMGRQLTKRELQQIESFERQVYAAQVYHKVGGDLTGPNSPPGLGPEALRDGAAGRLGNNPINKVFGSFEMWLNLKEQPGETPEQRAQREFRVSAARGAELFFSRRFMIQDVGMYNDKDIGNPIKRSCGSGCHNTLLMGMDLAPGYMDLGLNNYPWANTRSDLPLFKIVCRNDVPPQSYLGREIYTHDPGRALITGRCRDVGAVITQQNRALAARAPYFVNGSSMNLREMVDFYDRRFNIGYTEQEKQDLVNFMSTL